jgi:hypothetical protein
MIPIINQSKFPMVGFEHRFYHGNPYWCIVLKATYEWDDAGNTRLLDEQPDMQVNDLLEDESSPWSSLRYPTDLTPFKPATDVWVSGTAHAIDGKTDVWPAGLSVGSINKRLKLFGPRRWEYSFMSGWKLSKPESCKGVALRYENAYGGHKGSMDETKEAYLPNPIGTGWLGGRKPGIEESIRAPQCEGWDDFIDRFDRKYPPAGLSPMPNYFADRMQFAGTTDDVWKKTVAPNIPLDMKMDFWNAAPLDQRVPGYLKGGETIEMIGLAKPVTLAMTIPKIKCYALVELANGKQDARTLNLDTIAIDLDRQHLTMRYNRIIPFIDEPRLIELLAQQVA